MRADRTAYYAAYYQRHRERKRAYSLAYYRAHRDHWLIGGRHYRAANRLPRKVSRVTLDDRALTFTGTWPDMEQLKQFKPWNKK